MNNTLMTILMGGLVLTGAVVMSEDQLLEIYRVALTRIDKIHELNKRQTIESAIVLYQYDYGTLEVPPVQTLVDRGYLKPEIIQGDQP